MGVLHVWCCTGCRGTGFFSEPEAQTRQSRPAPLPDGNAPPPRRVRAGHLAGMADKRVFNPGDPAIGLRERVFFRFFRRIPHTSRGLKKLSISEIGVRGAPRSVCRVRDNLVPDCECLASSL